MEEAKIVEMMTAWKDEVVGLTKDYKDGIAQLKGVKDFLEGQKKKWWVEYKWPFVVVVVIVVTAVALIVVGRYTDWCSIEFSKEQAFKVERGCSVKGMEQIDDEEPS